MIKEIIATLSLWQDPEGYIHHVKNPHVKSSENRVLFTMETILLFNLLGINNRKYWIGNPFFEYKKYVENGKHLSHDNATAIASYAKLRGLPSPIPIFSMERPHPKDIIYYGLLKHPILFAPLMPLLSLAMMQSCWKKYKYRNGNRFNVTDGKMLAFIRMKTLKMDLTFKICTWLIKRNPVFGSWTKVAKTYFPALGHPVPHLMFKYENRLEPKLPKGYHNPEQILE